MYLRKILGSIHKPRGHFRSSKTSKKWSIVAKKWSKMVKSGRKWLENGQKVVLTWFHTMVHDSIWSKIWLKSGKIGSKNVANMVAKKWQKSSNFKTT